MSERYVQLGVDQIKAGDIFGPNGRVVWTATADAEVKGDLVHVRVRFGDDGGLGVREFDVGHELEIRRSEQ
jgi:hypothetical protein